MPEAPQGSFRRRDVETVQREGARATAIPKPDMFFPKGFCVTEYSICIIVRSPLVFVRGSATLAFYSSKSL